MGNSYTFNHSAQLFFLCGIGFGVSYSMTKINVLDWINTNIYYKFIRMVIAICVYLAIKYLFLWISEDSASSEAEFYFY